jgi:carbonic anhydrase
MNSEQALRKLIEGNKRFSSGFLYHPHRSKSRRQELSGGQNPFAIVLGCADSRVSPSIAFDQGLGDLFIIRIAGNVVNDDVLGSIEYAVQHLRVELVVVLGHEKCGAVSAAVKAETCHNHIDTLLAKIRPAIDHMKDQTGDSLENAVTANVEMIVNQLRSNRPLLEKRILENKLKIIGALYRLESGLVEFIENNKMNDQLE